ncbi:MAG TPA: hypothetical protein VHB21_09865, partial [Minicystis sp.]|nr:hypothetical protein [Minicystis sp.]
AEAARAIAEAFAAAFPTDVVRVDASGPPAAPDQPNVDVTYKVTWAGDVYTDPGGTRRFVSIAIDFTVTVNVPGDAALELRSRVEPPDDLEVKVGANDATASEGAVYDAMAEHAFKAVGDKVKAALLRPDAR